MGAGAKKNQPYIVKDPESSLLDMGDYLKNSPQKQARANTDILKKSRQETQELIDKYFTLANPIKVDTDEMLEAILASPEKMLPLF